MIKKKKKKKRKAGADGGGAMGKKWGLSYALHQTLHYWSRRGGVGEGDGWGGGGVGGGGERWAPEAFLLHQTLRYCVHWCRHGKHSPSQICRLSSDRTRVFSRHIYVPHHQSH